MEAKVETEEGEGTESQLFLVNQELQEKKDRMEVMGQMELMETPTTVQIPTMMPSLALQ